MKNTLIVTVILIGLVLASAFVFSGVKAGTLGCCGLNKAACCCTGTCKGTADCCCVKAGKCLKECAATCDRSCKMGCCK